MVIRKIAVKHLNYLRKNSTHKFSRFCWFFFSTLLYTKKKILQIHKIRIICSTCSGVVERIHRYIPYILWIVLRSSVYSVSQIKHWCIVILYPCKLKCILSAYSMHLMFFFFFLQLQYWMLKVKQKSVVSLYSVKKNINRSYQIFNTIIVPIHW